MTAAKPTRELLLDLIRERPGIKRAEMLETTGLPSGAIDPSRMRLWLAGLIEPDSEDGWAAALANRMKDVGWRAVDGLEPQREVAERAATRKTRIAASPDERARRIVEAMEDPTVARLVERMIRAGDGSPTAQRRVEKTLRKREQERRDEARRVQRDRTAEARFKQMLSQLWEARGAVAAVDAHLIDERARVANGHPRRIADHDWLIALADVRLIVKSLGSMWQNVRDLGDPAEPCPACGTPPAVEQRHLGAFVFDGSAVEMDDGDAVDAEVVDP